MEQTYTIQQTAIITGLSEQTLRYYERIGLMDHVGRTDSGYRQYSAADMEWIYFLNRLRATGMPIRRMQEFARLRREGGSTVRERRILLETHRVEVLRKIKELEDNLGAIHEKIDYYKELESDGDGK